MCHQGQESPLACALKGPSGARTYDHWVPEPSLASAMIVSWPTSRKALDVRCDVMFGAANLRNLCISGIDRHVMGLIFGLLFYLIHWECPNLSV